MLARLARADLPWATITVFQVDERVAPDGHSDRNLLLTRPLADAGAVVHAMPVTDPDLEGAAAAYASRLPDRFDVIQLGVGPDGHTASWPPGDPVIDAPGAVAISQIYQGRVRMTLTPRVVNEAEHRVVLVAGADKADAIARWVRGDQALPVSRVRQQDTILVVDRAAAPDRRPG
jgi:6-phosphogluconolactonase/glucosamine-6-phosphate isomerase/deaminase